MKFLVCAVLYLGLAVGANAAGLDTLNALRDGDMEKLEFHSEPRPVSQEAFTTPGGDARTLADWRGKVVVLNFWATWCAPCRHEMPMLDALQAEMGGEAFEVITIATGRSALPGIERFYEEAEIEHLPILLDASQAVARDMAVLGLPVTVILNREGKEIARLSGDAEWDSDNAKAIIAALIDG